MIRRSLSLLVCLFIVVFGLPLNGHPQTGNFSHIEVIARPTPARKLAAGFADAPPSLEISDFKLLQRGIPIAIHVAESGKANPKHLVIVAPGTLANCPQFSSLSRLRSLIKEGWKVQIADTSGTITPTITDVGALQAACNNANLSTNPLGPVQELAKQPGRRIVIFMGLPSPRLMSEAIHAIPEVYLIDGGVQVSSHTPLFAIDPEPDPSSPQYGVRYASCGVANSPNDICNMGVTNEYRENGFARGVMHEKSIASALKDVLSNERYFDLSFQLPSSPDAGTTPLELTIHYNDHLTVAVDAYKAEQPANGQQVVRMPIAEQIHLVQKM